MKKSISIFVYEFVGVFSFRFVRGGRGKKIIKIKANYLKWSQGIKLSIKIN